MICNNCGKEISNNTLFCTNCGAEIKQNVCVRCGAELINDAKFCTKCGTSVSEKDSTKFNLGIRESTTNDNIIVVESPEPLKNEMLSVRKVYYVFAICIIIGLFNKFFIGVGFLGAMGWYVVDHCLTDWKLKKLREKKFKILTDVTIDEIFNRIQPSILYKYGDNFMIEKTKENINISYGKYIYDIHLNNDGTFLIWWRKSFRGAFFSISDYKDYRNVLIAMGIIAYEVQSAFNICEENISKEQNVEVDK